MLAADVIAEVDVPAFDRSNVDGFAVRAEETYGAAEETPRRFRLNAEELATGVVPRLVVEPGTATPIATGGMLPRGADAVVMVEHAAIDGDGLLVLRPVAPGADVSFAGTDMARGELVLRRGTRLTSRETGVLAAIGRGEVEVVRRPRVAILSTGDEIIAPGDAAPGRRRSTTPMRPCWPTPSASWGASRSPLGIVGDDEAALEAALERALASRPRAPQRRDEQGGAATSRTASWRGGRPGSSSTGSP